MKKIVDERIVGLQKKFGFEALYLGSFLIFIDFMARIVFYKRGFMESIDLYFVMILPWIYYSVRGLFAGIYINKTIREKVTDKIIGIAFAAILLFVSVLGLSNDGVLDINSHPAFFAGVVTGVVFAGVAIAALTIIAKKKQKKFEED